MSELRGFSSFDMDLTDVRARGAVARQSIVVRIDDDVTLVVRPRLTLDQTRVLVAQLQEVLGG